MKSVLRDTGLCPSCDRATDPPSGWLAKDATGLVTTTSLDVHVWVFCCLDNTSSSGTRKPTSLPDAGVHSEFSE